MKVSQSQSLGFARADGGSSSLASRDVSKARANDLGEVGLEIFDGLPTPSDYNSLALTEFKCAEWESLSVGCRT